MDIKHFLTLERTYCRVNGHSKIRLLQKLADIISRDVPIVDNNHVYNALLAREKKGTTGFGKGIAIPHCRVANLDTTIAVLMTLDKALDYDAIDHQPVDIVFALLVPEHGAEQHLETLSSLAQRLDSMAYCTRLRSAQNPTALLAAAIESGG